ncbi:MAG: type II toxin-antitoxin system HicA family toxin [Azoarcus sp.]|nr:type II toxin-antitoxin system HicA family toxin [Azoarcus sp.]
MTWQELVTLLHGLGYQQDQGSGSRVKFDNGNPLEAISLHRPHPGNELKAYVKRLVAEHLEEGGMIR